MADKKRKQDPKKKRKQTPQEHVKRSQASKRRIRHKGEFAAGGGSHLHSIFHGTHNMAMGHRSTWKDDFPPSDKEQGRLFSTTEYAQRQEPTPPNEDSKPKTRPSRRTLTEPDTTKPKKGRNAPQTFQIPAGEEDNWVTLDQVIGQGMDMPNISGSKNAPRRPAGDWGEGDPSIDPYGEEADLNEGFENISSEGSQPGAKTWNNNPRRDSGSPLPHNPETTYRLVHEQIYDRYSGKFGSAAADQLAHDEAERATAYLHDKSPSKQHMKEVMHGNMTIRQETPDELHSRGIGNRQDPDTGGPLGTGRVSTERLWQDHRGTFNGGGSPGGTLQYTPQQVDEQNIYSRLPQEQQSHVDQKFGDKPGDRGKYLQLVSQGYSSNEIMDWMASGAPMTGSPKAGYKKAQSDNFDGYMAMAQDDMQKRRTGDKGGLKDKHDLGFKHDNFSHSIMATGIDDLETIRKRFPAMPESEIIKYQHAQRQTVDQYMLAQNERWAHESRAERIKGDSKNSESTDKRVVFFTTNAGGPTASVASDSLVGQYVIRKRKSMVVNDKQATKKEVKGEFPRAVRDQHLIELSTGVSLGVRGQYGLFHNTGWKAGNKKSKGYGKHSGVGATIQRDPTGQPVYDKDGNVRYTEGYTKMFDAGTNRDVGLRIFIG